MKKGIKFRDSSVLSYILFLKKSELFTFSRLAGTSKAIQMEIISTY